MVSWQDADKNGNGYYYRVDWNDRRSSAGEAVEEDEAIGICERLIAERKR